MAAAFGGFSASQFEGGFVARRVAVTGALVRARDSATQTLRAVTIKQLADVCAATQPHDEVVLDGAPLSNVTLVGKIVTVTEHAAHTSVTLDDGTGTATAKWWAEADDDGAAERRRAELRPGAYARLHGSLRDFGGERALVAYAVRPVADGNEVTYHFLQAAFQHAHLKAGTGGGVAVTAAAGGAPAPAAPAPAAAGADDVGADGLTGMQRQVKAAVAELGGADPNGAAVDAVCTRLAPVPAPGVRAAVAFLLEEGHLYATVDEHHVKVA